MAITNLGDLEVQYVSCYYTRRMKVLAADRRRDMNPILTVYSNDESQMIYFVVSNVIVERQRKEKVKEGLDIYIVKSEVTKLKDYLHKLLPIVSRSVTLDRSMRDVRDPRVVYNNIDGGLPIPISILEGWTKIQEVKADYISEGYSLKIIRAKEDNDEPQIHMEMENKPSWSEPRMHMGIHIDWIEEGCVDIESDKITIVYSWKELGQLYGRVLATERKM